MYGRRVELISEMMILERRLVQVGSGAALGLPCLVWRGMGWEEFADGDPTHTQNLESRSHRPRAWCVCVCV